MKTFFRTGFSIMLLLAYPYIYSMDIHPRVAYIQQQQEHPLNHQGVLTPTNSSELRHINSRTRRTINAEIKQALEQSDSTRKTQALQLILTKLTQLTTTEQNNANRKWLDQKIQELETELNSYQPAHPYSESTHDLSQTVFLEQELFTLAQELAKKESELTHIKRQAEQSKVAYKERLSEKHITLERNKEQIAAKEQEQQATLRGIEQALEEIQLEKQRIEEQQNQIQSRMAIIDNYNPVILSSTVTLETLEQTSDSQYSDGPTEDLMVTPTKKDKNSQLSHSCNLQ